MLECVGSTPCCSSVLAAIEAAYDIPAGLECELLQAHLDATYLLRDEVGRYVVRLYNARWWGASEVTGEVELLRHLVRAGVCVAEPLARRDGQWVTTAVAPEGERQLVVTRFLNGEAVLPSRDARQFGELAGKVHQATEGYEFTVPRRELTFEALLRDSFDVLISNPRETKEQREYLEGLRERVTRRAIQLGVQEFRNGICHGDLNFSNAVRLRDGRLALFDFEMSAWGLLAYDVAVFRWTQKVVNAPEQAWQDFLKGHRLRNPLSDAEYAAADLLAVVRHAYLLGHWTRRSQLELMGTAWRRPPRMARMDALRKLDAEAFGTEYVEPKR